MQATTSSSHQVSPITCPPQEKPQVTLADVLRGGAENDRRSLQAYLHTLAAREKEKRKRKRQERKSKRSTSSKKKKRSEDDLSTSSPGSTASLSSSSSLGTVDSQNNTPSGSIDLSSSMMMRGSVDLTAMRLASNEYDAMRGSLDMSAMGHAHHMRSRSVDFGALRANTAAFDAMRASLDMSAMGPGLGLGAHYSHHGSFAGYQPHLGGGSASGPAYARASCDFDAMSNATGFGADISPTSSFCMEGPVFLEPAPLASFSVDEHSPQSQQQQPVYAQSSQPTFAQPHQAQPVYSSAQMLPPQAQLHLQHQPQQQMYAQSSSTTMSQQPTTPLTDLPDFEDFVSSAFLEAFPEDAAAAAIDFNPSALLEQQQPFVEQQQQQPQQAAPVFAVPAPPQHVLQRSQSPAPVPQQLHLQYHPTSPQHQQPHRSCSCPDCHVTPVTPSELNSAMAQHGYVPAGLEEAAAAVVQQQPGASSGQRVVHPSFAVEEDQANDFLAQFLEWSEQRGVASPLSASLSSPSVSSPATSLYF